ncbi:TetR/AcrR family transcriptional regulator [Nonomuraea sp. NPDC055795]
MPKQVDHEQRRRQISQALWRVAAERGLEAVSMREVAAAAGMSIGLVQHYFASKEDMLLHATLLLRDRLEERLRRAVAALPEPVTPQATLRAMFAALLPADPASRSETLVANAVFIRALNDPVMADRYRLGRAQLTTIVADLIRAAHADADDLAEQAADTLLALVNGLSSDLLLGHLSVEGAVRILNTQLDTLIND